MEKMMGAYYPTCSSRKRKFSKYDDVSGVFTIEDKNLIFTAKFLFLIKRKSRSFCIPLKDIKHVEKMNLNGILPFGVCVYLNDGREVMIGHVNNQKLFNFVNEAREKYSS